MSSNNIRLHEYTSIDKESAQQLFSHMDERVEVVQLSLIPQGLSTTNYIVAINDSVKKYLLKIYPENGGNYAVEMASYKFLKQYVNIPHIYTYDITKNIFSRPYVIMEYIEGHNLQDFIAEKGVFPENIAYEIGRSLALIHKRKYDRMALLGSDLEIAKKLIPVIELHEYYLNGLPGRHINKKLKQDLLHYIASNRDILKQLENTIVYSHGDFSPSNILINCKDSSVWLIDFEYSLAAPNFYDIGKFFRGNMELDKYRDENVYDRFFDGYNSNTELKLPKHWIKLAKLMDMTSLLALINKENPPFQWVREIENEMKNSFKILMNETDSWER